MVGNYGQPVELRPSIPTGHKETNSPNNLMILEANSCPAELADENAAHPLS